MKLNRSFTLKLTIIAVTIVLMSAALPASAATVWSWAQLDNDWCWDTACTDVNSNGLFEEIWFDVDSDCLWGTHFYNICSGTAIRTHPPT